MNDRSKIWTFKFILLLVISLLYYINNYILNPIIAGHTLLLGGQGQVGLTSSLLSFVALLLTPFTGPIVDRFDRKKLAVLGFLVLLISNLIGSLTVSIRLFIFSRILHGIGFALNSVLLSTLISSIVQKEVLGQAVAIYASVQAFAQAIAPSLGIWIRNHSSSQSVFIFCTIVILVCLMLTSLLKSAELSSYQKNPFSLKVENVILTAGIPVALTGVINGLLLHIIQSYTDPFTAATGYTNGLGMFFTVYALTMLLSRFLLAKQMDTLSIGQFILFCTPLMAAGFYCIQAQRCPEVFWLGGMLCAVGLGSLQIITQVSLVQRAHDFQRGIANSTYYIAMNLGHTIGGYFGGYIVESSFVGYLFYFCIALSFLPLLFSIIFHKEYFFNH